MNGFVANTHDDTRFAGEKFYSIRHVKWQQRYILSWLSHDCVDCLFSSFARSFASLRCVIGLRTHQRPSIPNSAFITFNGTSHQLNVHVRLKTITHIPMYALQSPLTSFVAVARIFFSFLLLFDCAYKLRGTMNDSENIYGSFCCSIFNTKYTIHAANKEHCAVMTRTSCSQNLAKILAISTNIIGKNSSERKKHQWIEKEKYVSRINFCFCTSANQFWIETIEWKRIELKKAQEGWLPGTGGS